MNTINPEIDRVFFDTHANIKKLLAAGFTEQQAEVQTEILGQLIKDDLVTKGYFSLKIKELEARLEAKIIKWVAGLLMAQTGIIAALVKLL